MPEIKFGAGMLKTSGDRDVISWILSENAFNSPFLVLHLNPEKKRLEKIAVLKKRGKINV